MIREMSIHDYDQMMGLWNEMEGLALSAADSFGNIEMYLDRNNGLSYVYEVNGKIVGTILCGHDGRRGFIYHLAVKQEYRKQNIGKQLVNLSFERLKAEGIEKCHIFVEDDNRIGMDFWTKRGWNKRTGFAILSKNT